MERTIAPPISIRGTVTPTGDKSISHRAAIFNAIAGGEATVENFQPGADCKATLRCLQALGVDWKLDETDVLVIKGAGLGGLREPNSVLNCGNSGTTIRIMSGLLSGQPFFSILNGDASIRERPMARVIEPLTTMGARISARDGNSRAPIAISGGDLTGITYEMPVASAQVKTAILLAGLYADGETSIIEPTTTRDHTERMLQAMGADIIFGESPRITVRPPSHDLSPLSLRVPGDISSAAPWLVLGAIHPDAEIRVAGVGVNPTRTGIIDALQSMGADIWLEEERTWGAEPVADVVVRSSKLKHTMVSGNLVPRAIDELPLIALAACFAEGETVIQDAAELQLKESDRIKTTVTELKKMGADIEARPDGFAIRGPTRLKSAKVSSHRDHRIAMMLAVAGAVAQGETTVRAADAVAVSYPRFWQDYDKLTRR
ncbi:MAG: 3-phosphoshikimate 1-carboxyvinyltransferase [Chloroflexi bacterium]|nr:3-phosphoshikimate 1-carboxyvinyltransferase [Chloroflexota bacterium]